MEWKDGYTDSSELNQLKDKSDPEVIINDEDSFSDLPSQLQVSDEESTTLTKDNSMANLKNLSINTFIDNLNNCLSMVEDEVMKGYLADIHSLKIEPLNAEIDSTSFQFFKISEFVYEEHEFSIDKLAMMYSAMSNLNCTLALLIKNQKEKSGFNTSFYLGIKRNDEGSTATARSELKNTLMGFFPGTKIENFFQDDLNKVQVELQNSGCITSVTAIADIEKNRNDFSNKNFSKGIEKFVDSMQHSEYTAIFIADSLNYYELRAKRNELENIYSQLSPFENIQYNFSVTDSDSFSTNQSDSYSVSNTQGQSTSQTASIAQQRGTSTSLQTTHTDSTSHSDTKSSSTTITESTSESHTKTIGKSNAHSEGHSNSYSVGVASNQQVSVGIPGASASAGVQESLGYTRTNFKSDTFTQSESLSKSISNTLSYGITKGTSETDQEGKSDSFGIVTSVNKGSSLGKAESIGQSESYTNSYSLIKALGNSKTFGENKGVQLTAQNLSLTNILARISKLIKRIDECESYGMWNFASYFLGASEAETKVAANTYKAIISGTDSGVERSSVNTWNTEEDVKSLVHYLVNFKHPIFEYARFSNNKQGYVPTKISLTTMVSSKELAINMGFPKKSVKGLPVTIHASFAKEVIREKISDEIVLNIGHIFHMGKETETEVNLDKNSLSMHTFVTGTTGSGKSNTIYNMLNKLHNSNCHFLVIEPAKGEYKNVFSDIAHVYGVIPNKSDLLKINPFSFPKEIHILEHLDRLIDIFNVCWPMYAAMPAVLKEAIEISYEDVGWDLSLSTNEYGKLFPSFSDVTRNIKTVIEQSEYDSENKGAYKGSLLTRLSSLSNGINGLIFSNKEVDNSTLFDNNTIIDLSHVGSSETKALIMGVLVLKLQEYRMTSGQINSNLQHVTVIEEAHNLLKNTSSVQSADSSNIVGKSAEMITNSIAEMRTYGEGFIIADQAPGLLDPAVIRNTNTKIILRLPEYNDRQIVGKASNLNDEQIIELAKLPKGVAAIYQNEWRESVLSRIGKANIREEKFEYLNTTVHEDNDNTRKIIELCKILCDDNKEKNITRDDIDGLSAYQTVSILKYIKKYKKGNDWLELSPVVSNLFPDISLRFKTALEMTHDISKAKFLLESSLNELTVQQDIRRGIEQCIITNYSYNIAHNPEIFEKIIRG